MKIEIIKCLQDNYSYLLIDEISRNACVVDPSEAKPIINYVESNNINLKYILNTHHHFDHVDGNRELKRKYNSNVIGFKGDKDRIPEIDTLVDDQEIWREDSATVKEAPSSRTNSTEPWNVISAAKQDFSATKSGTLVGRTTRASDGSASPLFL